MSGQVDRRARGTSTQPSSGSGMMVRKGVGMADGATQLGQARELHGQSRWAEACEQFSAADHTVLLDADDLER